MTIELDTQPTATAFIAPPPYSTATATPAEARPWRPIGELLVESGAITPAALDEALRQQQRTGQRLGEILIEAGQISWLALAQAIGDQAEGTTRPRPSVARAAGAHDAETRLGEVEALLRERQRAFIELVGTTESLRRKVAALEQSLAMREAELRTIRLQHSAIGNAERIADR